jgi:hypothetical protein
MKLAHVPNSLQIASTPEFSIHTFSFVEVKEKLKESRNRPGVAQRFPGVLPSQIFMTFRI